MENSASFKNLSPSSGRRRFLRDFSSVSLFAGLEMSSVFSLSGLLAGSSILTSFLASQADATTGLPLSALLSGLAESDALVLLPSHAAFSGYQYAFNQRTQLTPQVRILCKTKTGVERALSWLKENKIEFAIRAGGHSYEGFSQSRIVVLDLRLMNQVSFDVASQVVTAQAGALLGQVYQAVGAEGFAIAAGSCPTVGLAGHLQGGGVGLLARPLGLACDALIEAEVLCADGQWRIASETENADLFWAIRGGGGGTFGLVTQFKLKATELKKVTTFASTWLLPPRKALAVFQAWQKLIAKNQSPYDQITLILHVSKAKFGNVQISISGQSTLSEADLNLALQTFAQLHPDRFQITSRSFLEAVAHFSGRGYESAYMKGRSDYLYQPLSDEGIMMIFQQLTQMPVPAVSLICDSYGGAIRRFKSQETAFFHREALFSIQYYSSWGSALKTMERMNYSRNVYQALRPYVSGYSYVNYCDLEVANWMQSYWGDNVARLQDIKRVYDKENLFRHKQSVT